MSETKFITAEPRFNWEHWPDHQTAERLDVTWQPAPALVHMHDLLPEIGIQPDLEKFRARRKALVPFSSKEKDLLSEELYDRLTGYTNHMPNPLSRGHAVYGELLKYNGLLDENFRRLKQLQQVFDPSRNLWLPPQAIKAHEEAVEVLVDCLEASTSDWLDVWADQPGADETLRQEVRRDWQLNIRQRDARELLVVCQSAWNMLLARHDFITVELAEAVTHRSIIDLDKQIGSYGYSVEAEAA